MSTHRYLTTTEAAEILRCSVKTIYRMVKDNELMAVKAGERWLIDAHSMPSPDGPRRLPAPRPRKYGAPGTLTALAADVKATMAAR